MTLGVHARLAGECGGLTEPLVLERERELGDLRRTPITEASEGLAAPLRPALEAA